MATFWVLLRTMVRQYFGLSVMRDTYIVRREHLWKPALAVLGITVGLGPIVYGYVRMLNGIYDVGAGFGQAGLVIAMGFVTAQLVILFFGLFYTLSVFYFSTDLQLLVPLPVKPETLLAAKFSIVLLSEYLTALPVVVPALVIYGLRLPASPAYWLGGLFVAALLPLLPLSLAAIVAMLIMRFTRLSRHKETLWVISGLVTITIVMALQWNLSRMGDADPADIAVKLLTAQNGLINLVGKRFPPALWGALALTSTGPNAIRHLLGFVGITALALLILGALARRAFYEGLLHSATRSTHRRRQRTIAHSLRSRSRFAALVQREWLLLVRSPIFAMTAALNLFLPPVMLLLPILGAGEQLVELQSVLVSPRFALWGALGMAAVLTALAPMSAVPATAISREGKLFWLSRVIPSSAFEQLLAKMLLSVLLALAGGGLVGALAGAVLGIPWPVVARGFAVGIPGLIWAAAVSLTLDTLWPRLQWDNPQQAMKGNHNNLLALLVIGLSGYALTRLAMWWVSLGWTDDAILLGIGTILMGLSMLSIWGLRQAGDALFHSRTIPTNTSKLSRAPGKRRLRALTGAVLTVTVILLLVRAWPSIGGLTYEFGPNEVRFASVRLPYEEITAVEYLERIPTLSMRVGTSLGSFKSGTFTVAGIGRGKVFATDSTRPALLLRTVDTFYIITPENASQRYSELSQRLADG